MTIPKPEPIPLDEKRCACVSYDAARCLALRYPEQDDRDLWESEPERCECGCHVSDGEDEY